MATEPERIALEIAAINHKAFAGMIDSVVQLMGVFNTPRQQRLLELSAEHVKSATNPENNPLHPKVLQRAVETNGVSLLRGMSQMWQDLLFNGGKPSVSNNAGYKVGVNIGITPRVVVLDTPIMQLVRYLPSTETVYEVPMLIVPPLINGSSILDLQPGQSLVEYLVGEGHTVYMVQWKPADASNIDTSFEDYLVNGVLGAIRFINAPKLNTLGLCLGGDMLFRVNAYLGAIGDDVTNTQTTIVSLAAYPQGGTGAVGAMVDEQLASFLELKTASTGVMKGSDIAEGFSILLPEPLLYGAMMRHWFLGEELPQSPAMAWNAITVTDIPARAYMTYLKECYLKDSFAKGEFQVLGVTINRRDSTAPRCIITGSYDHIVPSDTALASGSVSDGHVELIEAIGGHVGTIAVGEASKRAKYLTYDGPFPGREEFLARAESHTGRWYTALGKFLARQSGERVSV